jgi:hypothetical protein
MGTIKETWKQVESDRWFNPAFQNFINTEIVYVSSLTVVINLPRRVCSCLTKNITLELYKDLNNIFLVVTVYNNILHYCLSKAE